MKTYSARGATPQAQAYDLAAEALASGEAVVSTILGHHIVAWPGDSAEKVFAEYTAHKAAAEAADRDGKEAMDGSSNQGSLYWRTYWRNYWPHYRAALTTKTRGA